MVYRLQTKTPSSTSGTKEFLRGTTRITFQVRTLKPVNVTLVAITGFSVTSYLISLMKSLLREDRRVQSFVPISWGSWRSHDTVQGFHLALPARFGRSGLKPLSPTSATRVANVRMTYYSCHDLVFNCSGPRGIRTPDLLNAIETRSQLRYGPGFDFRLQIQDCRLAIWSINNQESAIINPGGPEGIRTPDLLSAIEARSQLRYRPIFKVQGILPEAQGYVKQSPVKWLYNRFN
jgi:hypothetical protein